MADSLDSSPAELSLDVANRIACSVADRLGLSPLSLLRLGTTAVFRCGDTSLRIGPRGTDPEPTIRLVRFLAEAQIPVPVPLDGPFDEGGYPVVIWRWVEATGQVVDGESLGQVVARLHGIDRADIQAVANIGMWSDRALADPGPALAEIGKRSLLPRRQLERLEDVYQHHRGWEHRTQTPVVVSHGDLHLNNVVATDDGLCLIDWDTLCLARGCWDHAMFTTLALWGGPPGFYEAFARGYGGDYSPTRLS